MKTKSAIVLGVFTSLTQIPSVSGATTPQKEEGDNKKRPNILFIMSDDHTHEGISAFGGRYAEIAPTPNIDQIAETGVLMGNMLGINSISGPSRAALLTGKYSTTNGFYQNEGGIVFDGSQWQYQKELRENGYTTAIFGKWHLYSTPQGFDHYMIHANGSQQGTYWNPLYDINGEKQVIEGYATNLTTDYALEWLGEWEKENHAKGAKGDKPFAMMLHYKAPHRDFIPDSIYTDLFNDIDLPIPETFNDDYSTRELTMGQNMASIEFHTSRNDLKQTPPADLPKSEHWKWLSYGGGENEYWTPDSTMTAQEVKVWKYQNMIKDYLRTVRSVDDNVGRVLQFLEENDLLENTSIVYMGDQGFYLGENGLYDKRWMYETSLQMPCLISYPAKIKAGTKVENLTLNVDIAPTLLDFAGIKAPKEVHGKSMKGILMGDKKADRNWRKSAYYQYFEYPLWHRVQPHYGVRTDRYKLIHFYYNIDVWEFYDLEKDPNELTNQYNNPEYAKIIKGLKREINKLQKENDDVMTLDARRELTDRYQKEY